MTTRQVGELKITRIGEQMGPGATPTELLPDWQDDFAREHAHWLAPNYYDPATNRLVSSIHSWLIQTRHHTILIDTCCGNHKHRPGNPRFHNLDTPYLDRLLAAGVCPEDVDFVMCTHLHGDHVGWNTRLVDGRWVPTFPNAKYVFSRTERDCFDPDRNPTLGDRFRESNPLLVERFRLTFEDSISPIIAAGQDHVVEMTDALDDGFLIEPAPGHTPGHIILRALSQGREALFAGDVLHHPAQVYRPEWNDVLCADPVAAIASRKRVLGHCAEHGSLFMPGHFATPHLGRVREKGGDFSFEFDWAD